MKKISVILAMFAGAFLLGACDSMDSPSPIDTRASGSGEINPDNLPGDSSGFDAASLRDRGVSSFDADNIRPEDIVETIYFGFDQYAVPAAERSKVKSAASFFASNPDYKAVLVGHTDWYGTDEYNLLLSEKRCAAVSDYMASSGGATNTENVGKGEAGATPDVAKDSPEARHDRRVDIVKVK